ncbi:MAG: heavy metal translocating P-type ATPase [Crocinitomicaceae bacterium]|nr:heavy metal translocating P-type ATPase [Crocinitomicaceae bacterium]
MAKKSVVVTNMTCAACAASVERFLKHQDGVTDATVNFANEKAQIEFTEVTSLEQLKSAVQMIGYDLIIADSESEQQQVSELKENAYKQLKKRVVGALIFAVPLFVIGMFFMHMPYANYIMWALSTPMLFYFGRQFFIGAWNQLKHRSANMDTLVAMSTGIAYVFSVFTTLFPQFWERRGIDTHVYFEAAGIVVAFILLGKLLEERAKGNTSSAIKKLMGLQPKTVTVIIDGVQQDIAVGSIQKNAIVLVKPGERIAVDGEVMSGTSYVDESTINGEPIPVSKQQGDKVFAGTINQKGSFQFKAEKVGSETLLAQIIKMVEDAQGSKAPVQRLVDKIAAVFVPTVIGIALLSFIIWMFVGGEHGFEHGLIAAVTILVIACPCALGLATPTAIMVGVGKAAEKGILIKDAESIELAKKIDVVVLDKTGTITEGKPVVTTLNWFDKENQSLKDILFTIEKSSEHPLADAIVEFLKADANFVTAVQIENISGQGIVGKTNDNRYFIGNEALIQSKKCELTPEQKEWSQAQFAKAQTVVFFFDEQQVYAAIAISDKIKSTSKQAVSQLHAKGIKVVMLTGDNEHTAKVVSAEVGIDEYKANVLPADKATYVKEQQNLGKVVAMVGDGINDSNALAQADVSIAMGKGSDIAMDVAKMTIISSDLTKIVEAITVSKQTTQAIRQNLFWAFIYNVIGIPIAAGVLYPVNGFLLDPMWAGAAMAFSSVSVVSNSLLLKARG